MALVELLTILRARAAKWVRRVIDQYLTKLQFVSPPTSGPKTVLLLDGCNLPVALSSSPSITMTTRDADNRVKDWTLQLSRLVCDLASPFSEAVVVLDGKSPTAAPVGANRRLPTLHPKILLATTATSRTADDDLINMVQALSEIPERRPVTMAEALHALEGDDSSYFTVRRREGGERLYKKLWKELGISRPEGCHCLATLGSEGLRRCALREAHRLLRVPSRFVEVLESSVDGLRAVVVTNDVLLASRCVQAGALTLAWNQLQHLCSYS